MKKGCAWIGCQKHHRFCLGTKIGNWNGRFTLVSGGKRAYLNAHIDGIAGVASMSGAATLRRLANAILAEVGRK